MDVGHADYQQVAFYVCSEILTLILEHVLKYSWECL